MSLLISYDKEKCDLVEGLPDQIAQYKIHGGEQKKGDNPLGGSKIRFKMKISNNIHQIPCLDESELQESWNEEEKIAIKKPKAAAPAPPKEEAKPAEGAEAGAAPAEGAAQPEQPAAPTTEQDFEIK